MTGRTGWDEMFGEFHPHWGEGDPRASAGGTILSKTAGAGFGVMVALAACIDGG